MSDELDILTDLTGLLDSVLTEFVKVDGERRVLADTLTALNDRAKRLENAATRYRHALLTIETGVETPRYEHIEALNMARLRELKGEADSATETEKEVFERIERE